MMKELLLLTLAIVGASAIACPKGYCDKVLCEEDLSVCSEENGLKIRKNGSFCGCCDICVTLRKEGQSCMPFGEFLGVVITTECEKDLICDPTSHTCIRIE